MDWMFLMLLNPPWAKPFKLLIHCCRWLRTSSSSSSLSTGFFHSDTQSDSHQHLSNMHLSIRVLLNQMTKCWENDGFSNTRWLATNSLSKIRLFLSAISHPLVLVYIISFHFIIHLSSQISCCTCSYFVTLAHNYILPTPSSIHIFHA